MQIEPVYFNLIKYNLQSKKKLYSWNKQHEGPPQNLYQQLVQIGTEHDVIVTELVGMVLTTGWD